MLANPALTLGKNTRPNLQSAASNVEDSGSVVSASPSLNSIMSWRPKDIDLSFATDSIWGDISIANTFPFFPTTCAVVIDGSPIPIATSRTLESCYIPASSINRLITFSPALSVIFHHFSHPLTTLFQPWRWPTLYFAGSILDMRNIFLLQIQIMLNYLW